MKSVRFGLTARVVLLLTLMLSILVGIILFLALRKQRSLIVESSMKEIQSRIDPIEKRTEWIRFMVSNLIELQRLKQYYSDQTNDNTLFEEKKYDQLINRTRSQLDTVSSTSIDDAIFRQMQTYAAQLRQMEDQISTTENPETVKQLIGNYMLYGRSLDSLLIQRSDYLDVLRSAFSGLDQSRYRIQTVGFFFQAHFDTSLVEPSANLEIEIQRILTELQKSNLAASRRKALLDSLQPLLIRRYSLYRLGNRDINLLRVGTDPQLISSLDTVRNAYYQHRPVSNSIETEYTTGSKGYLISTRTLFMKPAISQRAKKIIEVIDKSIIWRRYVEIDRDIVKQIKPIVTELKKLKDNPKPDQERIAKLYQEYEILRLKRENAIIEAATATSDKTVLSKMQADLINTETNIQKTEARLNSVSKNEQDLSLEQQTKVAEDQELLSELKRQLPLLKQMISEYYPESAIIADAFQFLREEMLYDKAVMNFDYDTTSYISYTGSTTNRKLQTNRLSTLRQWIRLNCSEIYSCGGISLPFIAATGELVRPRSALEKIMWDLDSTAIDELSQRALFENTAAFTRIFSDQSMIDTQLKNERQKLLDMALSIGLRLILVALLISVFFVQSVKRIIEGAQRIGSGDFDVTFEYRNRDELGLLVSALNRMTIGLREREKMKAELSAAEQIQRQLLPKQSPASMSDWLSFGNLYRPSSGVGGDYFDFIEINNDQMAFCIADVTGHGPGPAMIMAMIRAHLHSLVKTESSVRSIMEKLNDRAYSEIPATSFITFFLGIYDRRTGTIEYSSAGHNQALIFRYKSESVEEIPGGGLPLGLEEAELFNQILKVGTIQLERGDLFFQYTDGVNEAANSNSDLFGIDQIKKQLQIFGKKRPDAILQHIAKQVENFSNRRVFASGPTELDDDIAMIAFRRLK